MPSMEGNLTLLGQILKQDPSVYEEYANLVTSSGVTFARCIKTGMDHPGRAGIAGVVAGDEECFSAFKRLFDPIIKAKHHGYTPDSMHLTNLDPCALRVARLDDNYVVSTRVRAGRSIRGLRLPPACSTDERREVERVMVTALLNMDDELVGDYCPLSGSEVRSACI